MTTREEVLLALGDPDDVGPACFRDAWTLVQGYLVVGIPFAGAVEMPLEVKHQVVVHFDADGRVEAFERAETSGIRRPCSAIQSEAPRP